MRDEPFGMAKWAARAHLVINGAKLVPIQRPIMTLMAPIINDLKKSPWVIETISGNMKTKPTNPIVGRNWLPGKIKANNNATGIIKVAQAKTTGLPIPTAVSFQCKSFFYRQIFSG